MAMTLSAVMNLAGNFQAQLQSNAQALQGFTQQAAQAGNTIKNSLSENIGQKLSVGLSQARDALGAAGIASAGFLKTCIDGATKAQKTNADLAQTIKSTGGAAGITADEVSKMASEFSKSTTFGAGAIKTGQNMLLTFTNIGKDVFPQTTQAMLDMAQKMGGDPVSSSIQLGKALNDPTKGLTALTRVGITFTEEQKNQIETMQKAGDMAGAQKVILGELNKEFGGQAAAAAQTYDGQMKQLGNTFAGIKSTIGSAVLPYLQGIAEKLNTGAQAVSKFVTEHKQLVAIILSSTAVFGTLIGGAGLFTKVLAILGPTVQAIIGLIGGLTLPIAIVIAAIGGLIYAYTQNFGGMKDFIDGVIGGIVSAFKEATAAFKSNGDAIGAIGVFIKNIFGDNVANTVTSTLTVIKNIIMSLVEIVKAHMPEIKAVISTVFQGIQSVWNSVLKPVLSFIITAIGQVVQWVISNWPLIQNTIKIVITSIATTIKSYLNLIKSFWDANGAAIMAVASNVWNIIKTTITTIIKVVEDVIKAVMQAINGDWSGAWNSLCDAVGTIFSGVITIIGNILSNIGIVFKDIVTTAYNWGKDMVMGIVDGIKGAIGYVVDGVKGVADTIRSYLHFSVPDAGPLTDYQSWMPDFMQGLGDGIKVNTHLVTEPIKDLSVGIKTNTVSRLSGGVNQIPVHSANTSGTKSISIAKLADQIIVREEADIDKIVKALVTNLRKESFKMA